MKINKETKLGLFVIIAILILYWGVHFLKGEDIFASHKSFYSIYENTEGLMSSRPVTLNGYSVGVVESIKLIPGSRGQLLVKYKIYEDIDLPKNSVARIYSTGLMGEKNIEILLGDSPETAQSGDTLSAEIQMGLTDEINQQLAPLRAKTNKLLSDLDTTVILLQGFLGPDNQGAIRGGITDLTKTIESVESTARSIQLFVETNRASLTSITNNIDEITANIKGNSAEIDNIIKNFSRFSDTLAEIEVGRIMRNAERATKELEMALHKMHEGGGTAAKMLNDPELYNNLNSAAKDLDRLLLDLRYNPKRYFHISVFGRSGSAYSKEEIERMEKERTNERK